MEIFEALKKRKSVRAFLDKEIDEQLIKDILNGAKNAPSGVNMQPWEVYVVKGNKKKLLEAKLVEAFESGLSEELEYKYYPNSWEEPFKSRRKETALMMYEILGITRRDKVKQHKQWKANYKAFGAPVVLYCFMDKSLNEGPFLDYGMFIQSISLSAVSLGLATCIQVALAQYPSIVKSQLGVGNDKYLICGIALGYEDKDALINSYRTSRLELDKFVKFVD